MKSDKELPGGGFPQTRAAWCVAAVAATVAAALVGAAAASSGQLTERALTGALAHPAIGYYTRPAHDLVAELNRHIDDGTARVTFDEDAGYLRSVLDALHVPVE